MDPSPPTTRHFPDRAPMPTQMRGDEGSPASHAVRARKWGEAHGSDIVERWSKVEDPSSSPSVALSTPNRKTRPSHKWTTTTAVECDADDAERAVSASKTFRGLYLWGTAIAATGAGACLQRALTLLGVVVASKATRISTSQSPPGTRGNAACSKAAPFAISGETAGLTQSASPTATRSATPSARPSSPPHTHVRERREDACRTPTRTLGDVLLLTLLLFSEIISTWIPSSSENMAGRERRTSPMSPLTPASTGLLSASAPVGATRGTPRPVSAGERKRKKTRHSAPLADRVQKALTVAVAFVALHSSAG